MKTRSGPDYDNPLWKFVSRSDVFAYQQEDGSYRPERRPLTSEDLAEHEAGFASIGTYSLIQSGDDFLCQYVVFDLDTMDEGMLDWLCQAVEYAVDPLADPDSYKCLLLEASGGKGYHIWLLLDEWVPAYKVREWLDKRFWPNYRDNSLNVYDKLEVFPKQDRLSEGGFGNLVKLPLGKHARTGVRSEFLGRQGWATGADIVVGMNADDIRAIEERTVEERVAVTKDTPTGILATEGPVARFMRGEIGEGERNITFYAFFTWCAWNIHLPSDLAYEWWERLNDELPDPEDDLAQVEKTMQSAYARPPADAAKPQAKPAVGRVLYERPSLQERLRARRGG